MDSIQNPWLRIPAEEYEAHMASPAVGQLKLLGDVFANVLEEFIPQSVAVLGCATGNGFEHLRSAVTGRVIGVDINPAYLEIVESRYRAGLPGMELVLADVGSTSFRLEPVSLIYAALLFEYLDVSQAISNIARCLTAQGIFVAALQLPGSSANPVSPTGYASISALSGVLTLVDPVAFVSTCSGSGLRLLRQQVVEMQQGKQLFLGYFRMEN